jgi:hypothetical protein
LKWPHEVVTREQIRQSAGVDKNDGKRKFGATKRPWFLVAEPLDIRGEIIPPSSQDAASRKQTQ